jgi:uncharacterized protein
MRIRTGMKAGMTNPASTNCVKQGGKSVILDVPACGGELGVCGFPGGEVCEEWALMRGECNPPLLQ